MCPIVHEPSKETGHGKNSDHREGQGELERGAEYQANGSAYSGACRLMKIPAG